MADAKGDHEGLSPLPPIDMLAPQNNKRALLKTAAFVFTFTLWPSESTALAPDLHNSIRNRSAKYIVKLLSIS